MSNRIKEFCVVLVGGGDVGGGGDGGLFGGDDDGIGGCSFLSFPCSKWYVPQLDPKRDTPKWAE